MKTENGSPLRAIAPALVLALLLNPFAYGLPQDSPSARAADVQSRDNQTLQSPTPDNKNAATQPAATPPDSNPPSSEPLPDSPGALVRSAQLAPQQPLQPQPQPRPKEPMGTAAAETVPTMGVAASRPAGAALAPAKQRRVRTILIRVGALLGAGAAIGATVALSEGSPSRPPGAH